MTDRWMQGGGVLRKQSGDVAKKVMTKVVKMEMRECGGVCGNTQERGCVWACVLEKVCKRVSAMTTAWKYVRE